MIKHSSLILIACFLISFCALAQKDGPNSPATTVVSPPISCLGCPGSLWNSPNNAQAQDGVFTTANLVVPPLCFQSQCFYSRNFLASDFGFKIPIAATIKGFKLEIYRCANASNVVWDSIIQLTYNDVPISSNKASTKPWNTNCTYEVFGDSIDLWNTTLKPFEINDSLGVYIKARNSGSNIEQARIDHIQITVYFSLATGGVTYLRKELPLKDISMYPFSDSYGLAYTIVEPIEAGSYHIYNMKGQEIFSKTYGRLSPGKYKEVISEGPMVTGLYLIYFRSGHLVKTYKSLLLFNSQ